MNVISEAFTFLSTVTFKPKEEDLDLSKLGINCFFNCPFLGTNRSQALDITETLGINYFRILLHWDKHTQPKADTKANLNFVQSIIKDLPSNAKALIVISGVPEWLTRESNQSQNLFHFRDFCAQVFTAFKGNPKVFGYQIGNEPNSDQFIDNVILKFNKSPTTYVQALLMAYDWSKKIDPNKLIVSAATTSIVQEFPNTLNYNKELVKAGIYEVCDVYGVHYYGDRDFVNLTRPGGALYFLKKIKKPIWITEIGEKDFKKHKEYARKTIPFLLKEVPNILRVFLYQYDGLGSTASFGLKNGATVSALYFYLASKVKKP